MSPDPCTSCAPLVHRAPYRPGPQLTAVGHISCFRPISKDRASFPNQTPGTAAATNTKASAACHSREAVFQGCVTAPSDDVASGHPEPAPHQGGGGAQCEGVGAGNAPPIFQSWGETGRKSPKSSHWKRQREKTARCRDSRGRGWQAPRCPACGGQKSLRCLCPLSPCGLSQQA